MNIIIINKIEREIVFVLYNIILLVLLSIKLSLYVVDLLTFGQIMYVYTFLETGTFSLMCSLSVLLLNIELLV